ncbi:hypothetical protein V6N12_060351 [Hibiscus sabdariffa]|uniref:Uncharacterized protein n=1 Tax=Hibiscus sabdariffa TaxID=183260 RepID=A0ABR2D489_9ROSI
MIRRFFVAWRTLNEYGVDMSTVPGVLQRGDESEMARRHEKLLKQKGESLSAQAPLPLGFPCIYEGTCGLNHQHPHTPSERLAIPKPRYPSSVTVTNPLVFEIKKQKLKARVVQSMSKGRSIGMVSFFVAAIGEPGGLSVPFNRPANECKIRIEMRLGPFAWRNWGIRQCP